MMFIILERAFEKPFNDISKQEMKDYISSLNRNEFKRLDGKDYSGSSKSDIKKFIKQFWKWHKGENELYPKEVAWIKTSISKDEQPEPKPIISQLEAFNLSKVFSKIEYRILVLLLFDSGFRIDEMRSVKKKNITWEDYEENNDGEKCFWIKCTRSKTKTRKVPIPLFTEDYQAFINSAYYNSLNDDDYIFSSSRNAILKAIRRACGEIYGIDKKTGKPKKHLTPHAFRHSSATYWAGILNGNLFSLCDRFGWAYDSDEAKVYVRLSGAHQKLSAKRVFDSSILELKKENQAQQEEIEAMQKQIKILMETVIKEKT